MSTQARDTELSNSWQKARTPPAPTQQPTLFTPLYRHAAKSTHFSDKNAENQRTSGSRQATSGANDGHTRIPCQPAPPTPEPASPGHRGQPGNLTHFRSKSTSMTDAHSEIPHRDCACEPLAHIPTAHNPWQSCICSGYCDKGAHPRVSYNYWPSCGFCVPHPFRSATWPAGYWGMCGSASSCKENHCG